MVGLLITKLGKVYCRVCQWNFLIRKYLAKLQPRSWLSRALSSSFSSVLARQSAWDNTIRYNTKFAKRLVAVASEALTTLLLVTLPNIHRFWIFFSLTDSAVNAMQRRNYDWKPADQRHERLVSFYEIENVQVVGALLRQCEQQLKQRLGLHLQHT